METLGFESDTWRGAGQAVLRRRSACPVIGSVIHFEVDEQGVFRRMTELVVQNVNSMFMKTAFTLGGTALGTPAGYFAAVAGLKLANVALG